MCGRYELFFNSENSEMSKIIEMAIKNTPLTSFEPKEVFPSSVAPIIIATHDKIKLELAKWGFPGLQKNELIIHARSETAAIKPKFKQSFLARRCVIPSTGFYEWSHDGQKKKYKCNLPEQDNLYMAGIWNEYDGEKHFVILTTAANQSMAPIHNRMPFIIPKEFIRNWLNDTDSALSLLTQVTPELTTVNTDPYEQLTLL